jgi:hypothetical protein
MSRNVRDTVIIAKTETTYGVNAAGTGAANAMLCSEPRITPLVAQNVDRALVRPYFGGSEQLVGTRYVRCEFEVELAGSGTAGTAPAWGPLLRACAFAEVATPGTRVDYTPITNAQESVTIDYFVAAARHRLLGARGNVKIGLASGDRPLMMFTFQGLDGGIATDTPTGVSFAAFRTPLVVTDQNSGDVTFGGAVSPTGAPAITGGTAYKSLGIEDLDLGNEVNFTPLLGGESIDVTDRALEGAIKLDLTAAEEATFRDDVLAATLRAVSLQHGTAAGNRLIVHMPSVQLFDWSKEELNGRHMVGFKLRGVPNPAGNGNDELRLVVY